MQKRFSTLTSALLLTMIWNGFDEPPSIDLSHVPPAMGDSLCFTSPTRLDPRQLAVLVGGRMKSALGERTLIHFVRDGLFSIDDQGRIWRHFRRKNDRARTRVPIPARRAERSSEAGYLSITISLDRRHI